MNPFVGVLLSNVCQLCLPNLRISSSNVGYRINNRNVKSFTRNLSRINRLPWRVKWNRWLFTKKIILNRSITIIHRRTEPIARFLTFCFRVLFVCLFNWLYNMKVDVEMKMCNNKMNMNAFDVWIGAVFEQQNTCEFLIQDNESNEIGKQIRLNNEEKIDLVFTWSFFTEFRVIWWQSKISKRRSCWQVSK